MSALISLLAITLASVWAAPIRWDTPVGRDLALIEGEHDGQASHYTPGLGACGDPANTDEEMVVAVSYILFDGYPGATANTNFNPICNKMIHAEYTDPTTKVMKPIELTVRDKCPSEERCGGAFKYKLDLSPAAFKLLSPNQTLDIGILEPVKWWFVDHRTVSGGGGGTGADAPVTEPLPVT